MYFLNNGSNTAANGIAGESAPTDFAFLNAKRMLSPAILDHIRYRIVSLNCCIRVALYSMHCFLYTA